MIYAIIYFNSMIVLQYSYMVKSYRRCHVLSLTHWYQLIISHILTNVHFFIFT